MIQWSASIQSSTLLELAICCFCTAFARRVFVHVVLIWCPWRRVPCRSFNFPLQTMPKQTEIPPIHFLMNRGIEPFAYRLKCANAYVHAPFSSIVWVFLANVLDAALSREFCSFILFSRINVCVFIENQKYDRCFVSYKQSPCLGFDIMNVLVYISIKPSRSTLPLARWGSSWLAQPDGVQKILIVKFLD